MVDNTVNDVLNINVDGSNTQLYEFNKNYISYISQCTGNNSSLSSTGNCISLYRKLTDFDTEISSSMSDSSILNIINNPSSYLQSVYKGNFPAGSLTTNDKHDKIIQDYGNVAKQRTDLDAKLRELYDIPGSKSLDYKYNYDSTVYSGILLTIIASGFIYYTFTKL
jgi:hypothetical protein